MLRTTLFCSLRDLRKYKKLPIIKSPEFRGSFEVEYERYFATYTETCSYKYFLYACILLNFNYLRLAEICT